MHTWVIEDSAAGTTLGKAAGPDAASAIVGFIALYPQYSSIEAELTAKQIS